jgi:Resolvase, N terminal domain
MARADQARSGLTFRCAIYTRKSSDEGLEQEFNSLDAQREACEAYIVSQRHAGWVALADMYDDGGLSGGTMERPALKRAPSSSRRIRSVRHDARNPSRVQVVDRHARITPGQPARPS